MRLAASCVVASMLTETICGTLLWAQPAPQVSSSSPSQLPAPGLDIDRLPISVVRIQRQLETLPPRDAGSALRLDFFVDVYGQAPGLDLFTGIDLSGKGGVQYGPMTHREFLEFVTPKIYRAPVMDLSSIVFAAAGWAARKAAERRKQAEERRRQEERQRIEAEAQRLRESR